jgi:Lrp/AsnC family leucine-responsive transcriptional regulator
MHALDAIDYKLLQLLQENDQASLGELGGVVGLAPSSVKERIKRLRENDVITGFHARVRPGAVGFDLLAYVFVGWSDAETETPFLKRIRRERSVLECHHVTGAWNYLMKVRLRNTGELERFLADVVKTLPGVLRTETIIVMSSAKETLALRIGDEESPPKKSAAERPAASTARRRTKSR